MPTSAQGGHGGLPNPARRVFAPCSRSCRPVTLHGLTVPAALQLKAALPQLSVPRSANAAPALLTSRSSTCQPARPHKSGAQRGWRGGGARGVKKIEEE